MEANFKEKVYKIVGNIPKGKVATYKQIAVLAGKPNAARAVGLYMSKNTNRELVPCHRVVSSSGNLTGYSFGNGIETKKEILLEEGVAFNQNKVNLQKSQWINH